MTPRPRLSTLPEKPPARCHVEWKDGKNKVEMEGLRSRDDGDKAAFQKAWGTFQSEWTYPVPAISPQFRPTTPCPAVGRRWQVTEAAAASTSCPRAFPRVLLPVMGRWCRWSLPHRLPSRLFSANRWSHVALSTVPAVQCKHQQRGQKQLKATTAIKYVIVSALFLSGIARQEQHIAPQPRPKLTIETLTIATLESKRLPVSKQQRIRISAPTPTGTTRGSCRRLAHQTASVGTAVALRR